MKEDSSSKSDIVDSRNDTPEGISAERISHEDIVLIEKLRAVCMDMSIPKIRLHLAFQGDSEPEAVAISPSCFGKLNSPNQAMKRIATD